jgi:DNA gyrase/topoisomerase IV subunit A
MWYNRNIIILGGTDMTVNTIEAKLAFFIEHERDILNAQSNGKLIQAEKELHFLKLEASDLCTIISGIKWTPHWNKLSAESRRTAEYVWNKYSRSKTRPFLMGSRI